MPSIGDESDRTVILGEQRVYMEEPSGGHYTISSINADSIILMRGNSERPTVYAKDGDGFVKFASQRSMENISEQISLLNSREFHVDMNMPHFVEHTDKDLQHSEKLGRRLPDLSGLKSDNPLDKGYQPGDD